MFPFLFLALLVGSLGAEVWGLWRAFHLILGH
jgi:hypothetical protein